MKRRSRIGKAAGVFLITAALSVGIFRGTQITSFAADVQTSSEKDQTMPDVRETEAAESKEAEQQNSEAQAAESNAEIQGETLFYENSIWYYVKDGQKDPSFRGLVSYHGADYYIDKGTIDWGYTGLAFLDGTGYYIQGGIWNQSFHDVVYDENEWLYVEDGMYQPKYSGLVFHDQVWYYVKDGKIRWNDKTLAFYNNTWFYVEGSRINWGYTGLAAYYSDEFYVQGGVLNWGIHGLKYTDGKWVYLENSWINKGYEGLTFYHNTWFFVKGGTIDWGYTGLVYYNHTWFFVKGGMIDWGYTGLVAYKGSGYFVRNGVIDWSYNGQAVLFHTNQQFLVKNGWADLSVQSGRVGEGKAYTASDEVQNRILRAAISTRSPGAGWCARWVSMVYRNAGLGYIGGNACDMYRKYTFTSDASQLQKGMLVAVESSSSGTLDGARYGHVGIYIGDGQVMDNIGRIRVVSLEKWIASFCKTHPVGYGYPPPVENS